MSELEAKWFLRTQDDTFGPETQARLVEWARMGRIQPGQEVSDDNVLWRRVEDVPFLDMRFSIDLGDGNPRGPFNRAAAEALIASGRLPPTATMVEVREPFPADSPAPEASSAPPPETKAQSPQEPQAAASPAEPQPPSPPPERVVEKVVEKIVEVPVEKVVERVVEKVVVDETRVRELEELLAEERRHTGELQSRMDEASKAAAAREQDSRERIAAMQEQIAALEVAANAAVADAENASKVAAAREQDLRARADKLQEQVTALEDELRRLPQAASEVADIQAAMYSIMTAEAEELQQTIEQERREAEEYRKRYQERSDRLLERRRNLLKRSGTNIEEMTRRALVERPEDPRTTQLRKELEELRRVSERSSREYEDKVRGLSEQLKVKSTEAARLAAGMRDVTQLQQEIQSLREQLQVREKDLIAERQKSEEMRQQQAVSQQAMMARLAALESPSIGTAQSLATNQSREAKMVKLPRWMKIGS